MGQIHPWVGTGRVWVEELCNMVGRVGFGACGTDLDLDCRILSETAGRVYCIAASCAQSERACIKPNSITLAGSELVRSWFESDSVMEFGFYSAVGCTVTVDKV